MSAKIYLGVDIGHGESAACCVKLRNKDNSIVEKPKIQLLQVMNNTPKVYTTISYSNGFTNIGVINDDNVIAYFKRSPLEWDNECPGSDGRSYRSVMGDFIGKMTECLLSCDINPEISGYEASDIALYVGCPSDLTWTNPENRKAYEQLIRESTGIEDVTVASESTAAIFSVLSGNQGAKLNPSKGIAVYDFGSLTADFTYVQLGLTLMEASWSLGASAIESNIIETVLSNELEDDYDNVYNGDIIRRLLKCRCEIKEAWFGDGINQHGFMDTNPDGKNCSMMYCECDEFGNLKMRTKANGTQVPKIKSVNFDLDQDLMDTAIKETPISNVTVKGIPVEVSSNGSWYQYCRAFLSKCRNQLVNRELPCEAIVLTGGASRMPFIKELCESIYEGTVKVYCDDSPSYCVCRGLCQIAINHNITDNKMDSWKKETRLKMNGAYNRYRDDFSDALTDYLYNSLLAVLKTLPDGSTVQTIQNKLADYIKANLSVNAKKMAEKPYAAFNKTCSSTIAKVANSVAANLYGNNADRYSINHQICLDLKDCSVNFDPASVIDTSRILPALTKAVGELTAGLIAALVGAGLLWIPGLDLLDLFIAGVTYFVVEEKINNNPNYQIKNISKMVEQLSSDKKAKQMKNKLRSGVVSAIVPQFLEGQFGKDNCMLNEELDKLVDLAISSVSLEHFDKTIS